MRRCLWCKRRIWPWHLVEIRWFSRRVLAYHRNCRRELDAMLERDRQHMRESFKIIRDRCTECGMPRHPRYDYHAMQLKLRAEEEDRL